QPPDVVLQNGALFAPGRPPRFPYVLLLDNTCLLAERQPPVPEADIGRFIKFGKAWLARERETYQRAMAIATFSALVRQSLIDDYGVDVSVVHVVGAGANIVPKAEPRHHDDGRTLVFVGKDGWRRKGGPVLLRAFAILRRSRPDLRLLRAGLRWVRPVAGACSSAGICGPRSRSASRPSCPAPGTTSARRRRPRKRTGLAALHGPQAPTLPCEDQATRRRRSRTSASSGIA